MLSRIRKPFRLVGFAIVLTLFGFAGESTSFAQANSNLLQQGFAAFKSGDYDAAINDYTEAITTNPQNAQAYFGRSYVYMTQSKDNEAIADLTQAIQINPRYANAYFRRAFVYMIKGNYDRSIADLDHTTALEPNNAWAFYRRANANMMAGNFDQSISDLSQVIKIDPKYRDAKTKRGFIHMLKGDYAGAVTSLNQTIADDPTNPDPYTRLAWLQATCPEPAFRDGKKAIENAEHACNLTDWKLSLHLETLAAAYAEAGDFLNAIKFESEANPSDDQKARLALYQSGRPYHVDKYSPQLIAIVQ